MILLAVLKKRSLRVLLLLPLEKGKAEYEGDIYVY
jgi:hypothetical protein